MWLDSKILEELSENSVHLRFPMQEDSLNGAVMNKRFEGIDVMEHSICAMDGFDDYKTSNIASSP